jgi:hypothetical protein
VASMAASMARIARLFVFKSVIELVRLTNQLYP